MLNILRAITCFSQCFLSRKFFEKKKKKKKKKKNCTLHEILTVKKMSIVTILTIGSLSWLI